MRKKAQIQMGENIIVLVIFFFLLVIAVIFYANIQKSRFNAQSIAFEKREIIDLKTIVSTLPELQCTENNDITQSCIDIINLDFMGKYWQSINSTQSVERDFYMYMFGTSQIVIKKLDMIAGDWTKNWTLYSNPLSNYSSKTPVFVPISLYNATSNDYSFGVIELTVYSR